MRKYIGVLLVMVSLCFVGGMLPALSLADEVVLDEEGVTVTTHTLTVIVTGTAGEVKSVPKSIGIDCSNTTGTCTASVKDKKQVILHAITSHISDLLSWSGSSTLPKNCTDHDTCTFQMKGDLTVTATFGIDPVIHVTPKNLDFGTVKATKTKKEQVLVLNLGETDLIISTINLSDTTGSFSITDTAKATKCTGATLKPDGGHCSFTVVFTPPSAGTFNATATVISNDPAISPKDTVAIKGKGRQ